MVKAITVFLALFALDFVWARYTAAMVAHKAASSGAYAAGIICLSGTAAIGYTSDPWLLIPAAAGAFLGTFVAVRSQCV